MVPVDVVISEYVRSYNSGEGDPEKIYRESIQTLSDLDLQKISDGDLNKIVKRFLYRWGKMGRILGQVKFRNWETKLAQVISGNAFLLRRYAIKELTEANLALEKQHIKKLYGAFKKIVGQVAATKCLHILCPKFFPMWDTNIAHASRKERAKKELNDYSGEVFSNEDYFQFIEQIRDFIISHSDLLSKLAKEYHKTRVKIVDEVLWLATRRPLYLILKKDM